jgi:flagellar motility protein MotE (MotC chaperone)
MNQLVEQELSGKGGDPQLEARALAETIAECNRLRSAYQDQQAAGLMSLDELGGKLKALNRTRESARAELERVRKRRESVEELERDRDSAMESYAGMLPDALDALSGEERRRLYGMLRLEVAPHAGGAGGQRCS